ncbi:MAG: LexA family transcriptional regulator [Janthinobacterium lividum]
MHRTIDKVLAQLMGESGVSQADLARKTEVGQPTISRILKPNGPKGIKEPTDKQVRPLADFFGISTDQLRGHRPLPPAQGHEDIPEPATTLDLVSEMLSKHGKGLPAEARQKILAAAQSTADTPGGNVITVDFSRPGQVGDEVWIAHYDVRAAMGGGQIPHEYPEMLQDIRVSPRHLREMGVTFKEHFHLKMITGWGQSMAPTIKDRDPLLVDVTIREFTGDGIYLFSHDEMLYVKRLQKKGKALFKMISDNKHHDPEEIRVDDTHILARVLYVWNGQPV